MRRSPTPVPVQLERLSRRFGEVVAVDDLDLTIHGGEFFSLLGPSGCGKTTTLRMVAGLEQPSAGRIRLGDQEVTNRPAHQRDIGMVFQNYALFPHLTVLANVAYGLASRQVGRAEREARATAALAQVALAGYERRRPHELSGGQQQRVAVARALVTEPGVLLLDEPLSNLDARLRWETRAELRRLQQELGITTIYVTHDQEEALSVSDRLAVMADGRLQQVGDPAGLYNQPANAFVAGFIGSANLLPVRVVEPAGAATRVALPDGTTVLAGGPAPDDSGRALLCLRPEAVGLDHQGTGPAGVVRQVTFTGPVIDYEVEAAGVRWQVSEANRRQVVHPVGAAVTLRLDPAACCLLADEGDRT